jgi:hypothetical protein
VHDAASYQRFVSALAGVETPEAGWGREPAALEADPVIEAYKQDVDRTLLRENLRRTVEERVSNLVALQALTLEARRAGEAARAADHADGGEENNQ